MQCPPTNFLMQHNLCAKSKMSSQFDELSLKKRITIIALKTILFDHENSVNYSVRLFEPIGALIVF
jgi:hypothetical protein